MSKYRVVSLATEVKEEIIDAKDFNEAKSKWEKEMGDEELFFIEDEEGNQVIY